MRPELASPSVLVINTYKNNSSSLIVFVQPFLILFFFNLVDFYPIWYEYKNELFFLMINSTYLYLFFILFAICSFIFLFNNFRTGKNDTSNKILLKNLLEGLDMELPEELKALDNSSTDPQKLS